MLGSYPISKLHRYLLHGLSTRDGHAPIFTDAHPYSQPFSPQSVLHYPAVVLA